MSKEYSTKVVIQFKNGFEILSTQFELFRLLKNNKERQLVKNWIFQ